MNTANALGPIIDPTVGRLQPWEHWHSDRIPNGNKQRPTMKPKEEYLFNILKISYSYDYVVFTLAIVN